MTNIRRYPSIFMRMFRILFLSGLILILLLFGLHKIQGNHEFRKNTREMVIPYLKGLLYELGSPPDARKAVTYKKRFNISMLYQGADTSWTTDGSVFSTVAQADSIVPVIGKPVKINQHVFFKFHMQHGTFWVRSTHSPLNMNKGFSVLPLSVAMLFVLSVVYIAMRHLLNPVKPLITGANEVAKGNLDITIPVTSKDEFGKLTKSFNMMIVSIRQMITQKKQLLYDVSHELRSPITRIKLALEMLPDSQSRLDIANDVSEMETMIDELLESARLEGVNGKLNMESTDLIHLLHDLKEQYKEYKPGVAFYMPESPVIIVADAKRLRKAIRNVLENALKYSSHQSKPVELSVSYNPQSIELTIRDYGNGIDPHLVDHIFEPFYRVDQSRARSCGGYGLGLFLCKKIIEAHNGTIKAESTKESGTRVVICIPAAG